MQIIAQCEGEIMPLSLKNSSSCKGWADKCFVVQGVASFQRYVQYRVIAYILLLIPFLHMPFVVVLNMNREVQGVIDILSRLVNQHEWYDFDGLKPKSSDELQEELTRLKDSKAANNLKAFRENGAELMKNLSKEGHETITSVLFFIFHFVFGVFSMLLDGSLFVLMDKGNDPACIALNERAQLMADPHLADFRVLSLYSLIAGCVFSVICIMYLVDQLSNCLYTSRTQGLHEKLKIENMRYIQKKRKGMLQDRAHQVLSAVSENYAQLTNEQAALQQRLMEAENAQAVLQARHSAYDQREVGDGGGYY